MGGWLRAVGAALRLLAKSPALLIALGHSYRVFRRSFVHAAAREGMPEALATQLAREMRPSSIFAQHRQK